MLPAEAEARAKPGHANLFEDHRITWGLEVLGGVQDQSVLELGPLEGGHTFMLQKAGARDIVAVEGNGRAYLKCLCSKEMLGIDRASFLLGDFEKYLEGCDRRFDMVVASGVLYHMRHPLKLLELISGVTDRVMIWTHFFDAELIAGNERLADKFGPQRAYRQGTLKGEGAEQFYKKGPGLERLLRRCSGRQRLVDAGHHSRGVAVRRIRSDYRGVCANRSSQRAVLLCCGGKRTG